MAGTILVIGATGVVGSGVAAGLVRRGERVRGATRDPAAAARGGVAGVEYVELDFERPETFAPALDGVERALLIARPGDEEPERVAGPLIDAMARRGVRRVVNLTALGVESRDDIGLRRVERRLEASGLEYTHLRPNFFMQVFTAGPLHADIQATGAFHVPAAGARISWVDARDVAAVAVAALTEPGHAGAAYTLTGGEAVDHHGVARALSAAAGREIRYEAIGEERARAAIVAAGLSPERAERLIGFYRLVRAGHCAPVSPDVEAVLGRAPIPFARFAADHAERWRRDVAESARRMG